MKRGVRKVPKRSDINKILIIGSGPIIIGQACEFDYSGTQACKALRKLGYEVVLVNSNPATIMTDPDMADVTFIEPLNGGDRVIVLVNSLGGTPVSELYGVYGRLATLCEEAGIHLVRNLIGPYCTSLDMTGISITLLKVDDELMTLWDAPVHTPALRRGC